MRILSIIVVATIIISCASTLPPAAPAPKMIDQADTVILTINQNPQMAYRALQKHMGNQGFTVIESEEKPLTVETTYKTFGPLMFGIWGSYSMKIRAVVNDTSIRLSGNLISGTEIENSGGKNSPVRDGWNRMIEVAQAFPHKAIYFSRN